MSPEIEGRSGRAKAGILRRRIFGCDLSGTFSAAGALGAARCARGSRARARDAAAPGADAPQGHGRAAVGSHRLRVVRCGVGPAPDACAERFQRCADGHGARDGVSCRICAQLWADRPAHKPGRAQLQGAALRLRCGRRCAAPRRRDHGGREVPPIHAALRGGDGRLHFQGHIPHRQRAGQNARAHRRLEPQLALLAENRRPVAQNERAGRLPGGCAAVCAGAHARR